MKTIKVALIGCGRVSPLHVEGYQKTEGAKIVALCAPRLQKAYDLAKKYSLDDVQYFENYRDILSHQGLVDAVDIMTPDFLHADITKDCSEAGLHILCEKPLSINAKEAQGMYDAVQKAGIIAMVGLVYRFNPAVLTIKRLIDDGSIGDIYHFRARLSTPRLSNPELPLEWRLDRSRGGYGALSDLGSHLVDLARFLTDDEFESVMGVEQIFINERHKPDQNEFDKVTAYDAATISGKMSKGTMINIEVSRFAAGGSTFEVDGSKASVKYINDDIYIWRKEVIDHQKPSTEFLPLDIGQFEQYETSLYSNFIHCIQAGIKGKPDFYDGLVCQQILDSIDESIGNGHIVKIN